MTDLIARLALDSVPDATVLEPGEYELRLLAADVHTNEEKGTQSIKVTLAVTSDPTADVIFHYMGLPGSADDERTSINKSRRIKDFMSAFNLPTNAELPEWNGAEGWGLLDTDNYNGTDRNVVKRFVTANA